MPNGVAIAARNKTLIAHVADPDSAWVPPNSASPDYSYFQKNPEWFMYGKPHPASKPQILQARDHILVRNPSLRVVGAHLGRMEANFHQPAKHFDRYPNFAVDLAAHMPYLALQPHADMIAFILKYQDRLIYATDIGFSPRDKTPAAIDSWERTCPRDWRLLATNDVVEFGEVKGQGLALPDPVLRKIHHDNAVQRFPGILKGGH
jgi:predicted TIM-barrel fold metal-dependent hydrolase